jgi:hypothetical protein
MKVEFEEWEQSQHEKFSTLTGNALKKELDRM